MVGAEKGKWIKPMDSVIAATMYSKFVHQEMGLQGGATQQRRPRLAGRADAPKGKVEADRRKAYKLSEAAEAMRHLETGRARGKIVIQVD